MSEKFYTILTNIGKAKIANSGVMGSKVNFVKFKIGDSNGSYYEPTEAQRDLIHTVYEGNITDIEVDKNNPNWIKINLMIPANVGGFTIREYGVFDESGNMLAVAKCAESYKPIAEDGSTKELILRMILAVSNTSSVNMELDPTLVFVSKDELEKVRQELTLHLKDLDKDSYPIVEATGTNAYIGASARIKAVGKGTRCTLFVGTASNGNCSLNLNNSGAVAIKDSNGNVVANMKANIPYNLCHNGSDFILQGKGGGGNLIPKYLLAGYYGEGDNGRVDGAMVNRGAPTSNLNCGGVVNLQEGYYAGGQIIANSLASQTGGATADDTKVLNGYTYWRDGILRTGNATVQSMGGANFRSGSFNAPVENTINGSSITYQKVSIDLSQCNFDIKILVLTFRVKTATGGYQGEEKWQTAVYDLYNNKRTSGDWMVSYGSTSSSNNYRSGVNTGDITSFNKTNVLVVSRGEHEDNLTNSEDQSNFGTTSKPYWKPNTIPVRWYAFG